MSERDAKRLEIDDSQVRDSRWLRYQPWLRLQARLQLDTHLQRKFDESDIAQQTLIEAWKSQSDFRGVSEGERLAWLRRILSRVLGHELRRYRGTQKRDVFREHYLEQSIGQNSQILGNLLQDNQSSPSQIAARHETETELAAALENLPEEYREVIVRRNLQSQSHEQIAQDLGKSTAAVRMLWVRALKRLKSEFVAESRK